MRSLVTIIGVVVAMFAGLPPQPTSAQSLVSAQSVGAGRRSTCALTTVGSVKCWGRNLDGQLGDSTKTNSSVPVDVVGLSSGVVSIGVGAHNTCAINTAGGVQCWGNGAHGSIGDGVIANRVAPVNVVGLSSGVQSVSGGSVFVCALTTAGGVKCWGINLVGEIGFGRGLDGSSVPVDVVGLGSGVQSIGTGSSTSCAVTTAGGVMCWGSNIWKVVSPALGDSVFTPVSIPALASGVQSVGVGIGHACVLTTAGGVKCWGGNAYGQLGDGTLVDRVTPMDVEGLSSGVQSLSVGGVHACAVTTSGGLKCWGQNRYGEVGDGTARPQTTPVDVVGLSSGVRSVSAGINHTCAVMASGGIKCWGANNYGQLGNGKVRLSIVPVDVVGFGTGVANAPEDAPAPGALVTVHPNPARSAVTVRFTLAAPGEATLSVYDVLGRRVATLARGPQASGEHVATWNPESLPGGLYVVRLQSAGGVSTQSVRLAR